MINCDSVRQELVALLDDELSPDERATLETHLAGCVRCAAELRELTRTSGVVASAMANAALGARGSSDGFEQLWRKATTGPSASAYGPSGQLRGSSRSRPEPALRRTGTRSVRWAAVGGIIAAAGVALSLYLTDGSQPGMTLAKRSARPSIAQLGRPAEPHGRADTIASGSRAKPEPGAEVAAVAAPILSDRDLQIPDELRARPGLFLDYAIVRRLEKLRKLESVLAEPQDGRDGAETDDRKPS